MPRKKSKYQRKNMLSAIKGKMLKSGMDYSAWENIKEAMSGKAKKAKAKRKEGK